MTAPRRPIKGIISNVVEVAALAALVIGSSVMSAAAGWIVGGVAGLVYCRGLAR